MVLWLLLMQLTLEIHRKQRLNDKLCQCCSLLESVVLVCVENRQMKLIQLVQVLKGRIWSILDFAVLGWLAMVM